MTHIKGLFIVLVLLVMILMTSSPVSARVSRIDFYFTGGDLCTPVLNPPHVSGPNIHITGTYTCRNEAFLMDGTPLAMRTGTFTWYEAQDQIVDGQDILTGKTRMVTDEGGVWEGSFVSHNGEFRVVTHGEGIYKGMQEFEVNSTGYILVTK
jgi:hypothetical protein